MGAHTQTTRQLRKVLELKMPPGGGDNGGIVAINLKNRNYYATIAGNKTYAMAFFNGVGEMVSPPDLSLLFDVRGMWYNNALKTFQTNGFGTSGWANYVMDEVGIPYDVKPFLLGQRQPFPQSVGFFNARENVVYFLNGSSIATYNLADGTEIKEKAVLLKLGYSKKNPPPATLKIDSFKVNTDYNTTTAVFTGLSNAEFGLLNIKKREIEIYNKSEGLMMQRLVLPPEAPVQEKLNFSFCNNVYWLYDSSERSWIGYR
jgi:hypothetical protein